MEGCPTIRCDACLWELDEPASFAGVASAAEPLPGLNRDLAFCSRRSRSAISSFRDCWLSEVAVMEVVWDEINHELEQWCQGYRMASRG